MYSSHSPVLSSLDQHTTFEGSVAGGGCCLPTFGTNQHQEAPSQCLRFKYFTTFLVSTTCLALLSASLATHKWIVSRPIRILKLNGGQTNLTTLMLSAHSEHYEDPRQGEESSSFDFNSQLAGGRQRGYRDHQSNSYYSNQIQNNKFQGDMHFGLFKGVKILNYGFGDRISQISVLQSQFARDQTTSNGQPQSNVQQQHELINFKMWITTLSSVVLAILLALVSSIFAIINFVMTPRGTLTGSVGLVIWNSAASFACLIAMVTWLIEFFMRLQANVLSQEEVQNGWTSENRSQFGYSYYLVVVAFILHLVNIFIVSLVQFETWTNQKSAKRQSRAACEGVIMLY